MPYGLYMSAEGASAQSKRLEVLTNNIANAQTTGFKRELAVIQARHSEAIEQGIDYSGSRSINDIGGGAMISETVTDFSTGPMQKTDIPTDVAINGDGFFVVDNDGEQMLTRAGDFILENNLLSTRSGHAVLDRSNAPLAIESIHRSAIMREIQEKISLVKPQSLGDLVKAGQNLFRPLAETVPVVEADRSIKPGFLERSSVKPALEMMEMIEASRGFEANIQMIKSQDRMISQLVSRVLK